MSTTKNTEEELQPPHIKHLNESTEVIEWRAFEAIAQYDRFHDAIKEGVKPATFKTPLLRKIFKVVMQQATEVCEISLFDIILQMRDSGALTESEFAEAEEIDDIREPGATDRHVKERISILLRNANRRIIGELTQQMARSNKEGNLKHVVQLAAKIADLRYDNKSHLPGPVALDKLKPEAFQMPQILIEGIIHMSGKLLFSGASKSRKTWAMIHLLLCIQSGTKWWGFKTHRTRALMVDLELMQAAAYNRAKLVAKVANIDDTSGLFIMSLRGYRVTLAELKKQIIDFCLKNNIGVIGIDPVYRIKTGEENSNDDIAEFLLMVEQIAHETGAAIILTHHFAKGNSAAKSSIDRMSGAGVWARDPDALISMTEGEGGTHGNPVFIIEPTLREFEPVAPFPIRWDHPLWTRDDSIKAELRGAGAPKKVTDDQILKCVPVGPDKAMRFENLGSDLGKKTFQSRVKDIPAIQTVMLKSASGQKATHYYRGTAE